MKRGAAGAGTGLIEVLAAMALALVLAVGTAEMLTLAMRAKRRGDIVAAITHALTDRLETLKSRPFDDPALAAGAYAETVRAEPGRCLVAESWEIADDGDGPEAGQPEGAAGRAGGTGDGRRPLHLPGPGVRAMRRSGFTLVECLLGLALSLFVISTGLELFARSQRAFQRLKEREEAGQAALAALDKMRIDLLHAGRGLSPEIGMGLVEAAEATESELRTTSLERELALAAGAAAGDSRLPLVSTADIAAGQQIALRDGATGEVRTVVGVEAGAAVLDAPLERDYAPETASLALLERVTYFLDAPAGILRRRVNASPAQPLLERTAAAHVEPGPRLSSCPRPARNRDRRSPSP